MPESDDGSCSEDERPGKDTPQVPHLPGIAAPADIFTLSPSSPIRRPYQGATPAKSFIDLTLCSPNVPDDNSMGGAKIPQPSKAVFVVLDSDSDNCSDNGHNACGRDDIEEHEYDGEEERQQLLDEKDILGADDDAPTAWAGDETVPFQSSEESRQIADVDPDVEDEITRKPNGARKNVILSDSESDSESENDGESVSTIKGVDEGELSGRVFVEASSTTPIDKRKKWSRTPETKPFSDESLHKEEVADVGKDNEGDEDGDDYSSPSSTSPPVPSSVGSVTRIPLHTPPPPLSPQLSPCNENSDQGIRLPFTPALNLTGPFSPTKSSSSAVQVPSTAVTGLCMDRSNDQGSPLPPWERLNVSAHWETFRNPFGDESDKEDDEDDDNDGEEENGTDDEDEMGSLADFIVNDSDEEIEIEEDHSEEEEDDDHDGDDDDDDDDEEEQEDIGNYEVEQDENDLNMNGKGWGDSPMRFPPPLQEGMDFSHLKRVPLLPLPVSLEGRLAFCARKNLLQVCANDNDLRKSLKPIDEVTTKYHKPQQIMDLTEHDVREYNAFLQRSAQFPPGVDGATKREQQAAFLAAALSICDQDEHLHQRLAYLFWRMQDD